MKKTKLFILLITILSVAYFCALPVQAKEPLRVGYIDYEGFISPNEVSGECEGYGVDYFQKITEMTGLEFTYVCDTWDNCLKKLKEGELDIVCPAAKTQNRECVYDFVETPIGIEETMLYTLLDNNEIYYEDYEAMKHCRIGVLSGGIHKERMEEYAEAHHFTFQEFVYETEALQKEALRRGEIDMFSSGSFSRHDDMKIVAKFNPEPFYIILNKEDYKLTKQIDEAIKEIKVTYPDFETKLYQTHYGNRVNYEQPLLTREEAEYIQKKEPIQIGLFQNYYPFTAQIDGKMDGICEEFIKEIGKKSGLVFEMVPIALDSNPEKELLSRKGIDIMSGMMRSDAYINNPDLQVSKELLTFNYVAICKDNNLSQSLEGRRIALPVSFPMMQNYLKEHYQNIEIMLCQTNEECLDAVILGKADATIQNEFLGSYSLQRPKYSNLLICSEESIQGNTCIVANQDIDPIVMSIINKTIDCISEKTSQQIISTYTISNPYKLHLMEAVYMYRYFGAVFVLFLVFLLFLWNAHKNKRTKELVRKKEIETYQKKLEINELTNLYNRFAFYQKVEKVLKENPKEKYQLYACDIEQFKIVNDLFGIVEGDKVLRDMAAFLQKLADERKGIAGYMGSDNFILCLPYCELYDIQKMEKKIDEHFKIYPLDFRIRVATGIYNVEENIPVSLMCDRANLAAASIKGNELQHFAIYNSSMRENIIHDQKIINEMKSAIEEGQFVIFIQEKVKLDTQELIGGEALVRWCHPVNGILPPGEFLPLFEKNGLISKIDYYVWEKTCQLLAKWKKEGKRIVPLSVNVSRLNFYLSDFYGTMVSLIEKYDIEAEYLRLEVTESAYAENSEMVFHVLERLQQRGFTIMMDDFGSGYSSLNMLQEAPVDVIKLDMKFLLGQDAKGRGKTILKYVIHMAKQLHFSIIAEGVETKEQIELLQKAGCNYGQGYYFSKPIPVAAFEKKIHTD